MYKSWEKDVLQSGRNGLTAEHFSLGAKYYVLTSKHHDGFANWPSSRNFGWNSAEIGPKRDVIGELAGAFKSYPTVKFGLYHSLFEWYNPMYLADKAAKWATR